MIKEICGDPKYDWDRMEDVWGGTTSCGGLVYESHNEGVKSQACDVVYQFSGFEA